MKRRGFTLFKSSIFKEKLCVYSVDFVLLSVEHLIMYVFGCFLLVNYIW